MDFNRRKYLVILFLRKYKRMMKSQLRSPNFLLSYRLTIALRRYHHLNLIARGLTIRKAILSRHSNWILWILVSLWKSVLERQHYSMRKKRIQRMILLMRRNSHLWSSKILLIQEYQLIVISIQPLLKASINLLTWTLGTTSQITKVKFIITRLSTCSRRPVWPQKTSFLKKVANAFAK